MTLKYCKLKNQAAASGCILRMDIHKTFVFKMLKLSQNGKLKILLE